MSCFYLIGVRRDSKKNKWKSLLSLAAYGLLKIAGKVLTFRTGGIGERAYSYSGSHPFTRLSISALFPRLHQTTRHGDDRLKLLIAEQSRYSIKLRQTGIAA